MKSLTVNCFEFTKNTTGMLSDGQTIELSVLDAKTLFAIVEKHKIEKINLIGPSQVTQRIMQELITNYKYFQVSAIPG